MKNKKGKSSIGRSKTLRKGERRTDEGGLQEVSAEENLVGRCEEAAFLCCRSGLELGHAVEAEADKHEAGGGDGPDHEGPVAPLEEVEAEEEEPSQRGANEQHRHGEHLRQQQREQQLDHLLAFAPRSAANDATLLIMKFIILIKYFGPN